MHAARSVVDGRSENVPQIEVRTRMRPHARTGSELVLEILLTPRGSGNRKWALALGREARRSDELKDHIKRVRVGSSKVWIVLRPSMELARVLLEMQARRAAEKDAPGQLGLFGGAVPA